VRPSSAAGPLAAEKAAGLLSAGALVTVYAADWSERGCRRATRPARPADGSSSATYEAGGTWPGAWAGDSDASGREREDRRGRHGARRTSAASC